MRTRLTIALAGAVLTLALGAGAAVLTPQQGSYQSASPKVVATLKGSALKLTFTVVLSGKSYAVSPSKLVPVRAERISWLGQCSWSGRPAGPCSMTGGFADATTLKLYYT